ncbi:FliA/WhiG family RNA polymerase sigma factor [Cellulomonas sp. SLBN-39]|uniref:FliA/WhiG family RNA polymerase sigma factor n=1 Tax=Cellulomonas sp. SLBN-39 TaxID=2768446 RepID=UPI001153AA36|nr:FliA/WhiG family RNA polymerase sigma factor [Cellulomonas sp. SLBN-39]TQL04550.1 RNA polymerase sigma-28 (SigD/FliA/WhiG) subunit [Cellulomonas sp. SLBN-39]
MTTLHVVPRGLQQHAGTAPSGVIPQQRPADEAVDAAGGTPTADEPAALVDDAVDDPQVVRGAGLRVADEVDALWEEFVQTRSPQTRERLILHYVPLVTAVAGRIGMRLPSTVEHADLVSYGVFGLIDAIEKYRTDRAVRFEAYASSRIRGAIIDELRAMDWVPRSVRTKARAVDRAYAELEGELHRAPTEQELARRMQVPVRDLRAVYSQLASVNMIALDELLSGSDDRPGAATLADTLADSRTQDPAGAADAAETKFLLARAIECLGERERLVVVLYYYESMTLAEIGRVLGVTESRISQIHTAAMIRLRTRLVEAERG